GPGRAEPRPRPPPPPPPLARRLSPPPPHSFPGRGAPPPRMPTPAGPPHFLRRAAERSGWKSGPLRRSHRIPPFPLQSSGRRHSGFNAASVARLECFAFYSRLSHLFSV